MRNRSTLSLLLLAAALMVLLGIVEAVSAQHAAATVKPAVTTPTTDVTVTVNTLANRHVISPYIYGANFPPTEAYITTGGVTRWVQYSGARQRRRLPRLCSNIG
jgi:hypothetical protein